MITCPACGWQNADGVPACEGCRSPLAGPHQAPPPRVGEGFVAPQRPASPPGPQGPLPGPPGPPRAPEGPPRSAGTGAERAACGAVRRFPRRDAVRPAALHPGSRRPDADPPRRSRRRPGPGAGAGPLALARPGRAALPPLRAVAPGRAPVLHLRRRPRPPVRRRAGPRPRRAVVGRRVVRGEAPLPRARAPSWGEPPFATTPRSPAPPASCGCCWSCFRCAVLVSQLGRGGALFLGVAERVSRRRGGNVEHRRPVRSAHTYLMPVPAAVSRRVRGGADSSARRAAGRPVAGRSRTGRSVTWTATSRGRRGIVRRAGARTSSSHAVGGESEPYRAARLRDLRPTRSGSTSGRGQRDDARAERESRMASAFRAAAALSAICASEMRVEATHAHAGRESKHVFECSAMPWNVKGKH